MDSFQGVQGDLSRGPLPGKATSTPVAVKEASQPAAVDLNTIHELNANQLKAVADTSMSLLPEDDQYDVAARAGFGRPNQGIVNWLWLIVVLSFALVLLGTTGSLIYAVIFLQRSADSVQVVVSVFTAVVGFLGGLFLPSPMQSTTSTDVRRRQSR